MFVHVFFAFVAAEVIASFHLIGLTAREQLYLYDS